MWLNQRVTRQPEVPSTRSESLRSALEQALRDPWGPTAPASLVAALLPPTSRRGPSANVAVRQSLSRLVRHTMGDRTAPTLALFGYDPAADHKSLTVRRQVAASLAGYEVHHFRKRIEPEILEELAQQITHLESTNGPDPLRPPFVAPERRVLDPSDIAAVVAVERERLVSAIWSATYYLHAFFIQLEIVGGPPVDEESLGAVAKMHLFGFSATLAYLLDTGEPDSKEARSYMAAVGPLPKVPRNLADQIREILVAGQDFTTPSLAPLLQQEFLVLWEQAINNLATIKEEQSE